MLLLYKELSNPQILVPVTATKFANLRFGSLSFPILKSREREVNFVTRLLSVELIPPLVWWLLQS